MKNIEAALQSVDGYLVSIKRNTVNGWYELEVGLPVKWVFDENSEIKCEVLNKNDVGVLVKISPKNENIVIDDLIGFVKIIIDTNQKIAEKEKEFTDRMERMKDMLETEARKFYEELDELRNNSFKQYSDNFVNELHPKTEKKEQKVRKSKENALNTHEVEIKEQEHFESIPDEKTEESKQE